VITGNGSQAISSLIVHMLKHHNRKFDYVLENQEPVIHKDSPTIIIQASVQLLDYKHHIGLLSEFALDTEGKLFEQFADATPKGGTLIYNEDDPKVKSIGARERADMQAIPYKAYKHEVKNGRTFLISSSNEKIPVVLSGALQLQYISAAKEVLKKLGITSDQFYKFVSNFSLT
jgi:UDP-N-acetylmuramate: L-alanyl-gamma-D-glutamyl-meso-diaminopimelate ligase